MSLQEPSGFEQMTDTQIYIHDPYKIVHTRHGHEPKTVEPSRAKLAHFSFHESGRLGSFLFVGQAEPASFL